MKTLCKGKSKQVAFLAFLNFVFEKADNVTYYHIYKTYGHGLFVARRVGCQNRVYVCKSSNAASIIEIVSVAQQKCYSCNVITFEEYLEILKNLK